MKPFNTFIALSLVSVVVLSGCGTANSPQNTTSNTVVNSTSQTSPGTGSQSSAIKDGVTKMLSMANQLKSDISSGDNDKVKAVGPQLEDTWSSFEDSVKSQYPDSYASVEQYLDPTVAGTKASPLDTQVVSKLNDQLIQALNDLLAKVNQ